MHLAMHLEAGPEEQIDPIQVAVQTGRATLGHNQLVCIIYPNEQQQAHQVKCFLQVALQKSRGQSLRRVLSVMQKV